MTKYSLKNTKKLQRLIKKEIVTIEYCEKQTEELKEIAKKLRIDINSLRVCKVINGVKHCGLKRVFKKRKNLLH